MPLHLFCWLKVHCSGKSLKSSRQSVKSFGLCCYAWCLVYYMPGCEWERALHKGEKPAYEGVQRSSVSPPTRPPADAWIITQGKVLCHLSLSLSHRTFSPTSQLTEKCRSKVTSIRPHEGFWLQHIYNNNHSGTGAALISSLSVRIPTWAHFYGTWQRVLSLGGCLPASLSGSMYPTGSSSPCMHVRIQHPSSGTPPARQKQSTSCMHTGAHACKYKQKIYHSKAAIIIHITLLWFLSLKRVREML